MHELYQTAVDLGPAGEDNTYGKGIIDVYAAYLSLSQRYTAVDPNQISWDLALEGLQGPNANEITCDNSLDVLVCLQNRGNQ